MREMKDSGVEWIGEIPKNWKVERLRYIIKDYKSGPFGSALKMDGLLPDGNILIYSPEHITLHSSDSDKNLYLPDEREEEMSQFIVKENDILFPIVGSLGKAMIITSDMPKGIINQRVAKFQIDNTIVDQDYFMWLFAKSNFYQPYIDISCRGSFIVNLTKAIINDMPCVIQPLAIQKKISTYLDSKCSKIDEIIEKQQAIIEKLKEYKLSVITEAVTSGLNHKREMKDSHVLSIGHIPTNWDVTKLKYLFGNGDDGLKIGPFGSAIKGKTLESGLYKIYNQAHLINNDFSLNRHFVSEDTFNDLKAYEVKPGDVLFSMMGTIGKCQIMPKGYPKGIMDSHLLKARLNEKVIPEFFIYAYDKDFSNQVIQQLQYTSNGTIMNGLNSTILKNVYIALPPLEEQEEIVEFLNNFTKNIDDRIGVKTKIVDKLQEYKKSLIYEVVTGKKEV